jgi:hypothetical protein
MFYGTPPCPLQGGRPTSGSFQADSGLTGNDTPLAPLKEGIVPSCLLQGGIGFSGKVGDWQRSGNFSFDKIFSGSPGFLGFMSMKKCLYLLFPVYSVVAFDINFFHRKMPGTFKSAWHPVFHTYFETIYFTII